MELPPDFDLSILPEPAKQMLLDFYQFLVEKYGEKPKDKQSRFQKFLSDPIEVATITRFSREELHDR